MGAPPRNPLDAAAFGRAFAQVRPWILEEWPAVDADALDATGGDADAVVALVAESADLTRARTRRLLGELLEEATPSERPAAPRATRPAGPRPAAAGSRDARDAGSSPLDPFERLVGALEGHLDELAQQVKADVAPLAADTARKHLGLSLLLAGGIGLMVGLFLGALGYGGEAAAPDVDDPDREAPRGNA